MPIASWSINGSIASSRPAITSAPSSEILDILPADQTAQLLAQELEARGFKRQGAKLVRRDSGIVIEIDPAKAEKC